ncbi:hypothetical protein [Vibrio crassostreae]|uniref:hypothetical protein n=1 Tax=Vibrio crassostreae TaxID=246167 RepID=UPI000F4E3162|nr:hypothetical protein [Vibrio crassostreae]RPF59765.1 hypothetical protein EDB61_102457 [Vibrio crassostreae]
MIFKSFAVGNREESFFEDRLSDRVNVIYSDDNNRGKTLVMQGLLYSIGNSSIFPDGFNEKEYTFYSLVRIGEIDYQFVRKGSTFVVKSEGLLKIFDTDSELRSFIASLVGTIPRVHKKGTDVTVDLTTFYEMFFIGQDKRNPSSLIGNGYFKKDDFKSMLCQLGGIKRPNFDNDNEIETKQLIRELKIQHKSLVKKLSLLSKTPSLALLTSKTADHDDARIVRNKAKLIAEEINEKRKQRNRETIRVEKLTTLINELNSLNRNMDLGEIVCSDCGSVNIVFKNKNIEFDVSNKEVRSEIIKSISDNISDKNEAILSLSYEINTLQTRLRELEKTTPSDLFQLAMFSEDIRTEEQYDSDAHSTLLKIRELEAKQLNVKKGFNDTKAQCSDFIERIVTSMNNYCNEIDPNARLHFSDLFSKPNNVFSGSDEQEYYYCRTMAINEVINHNFPIIIDAFRDGELSSSKEEKMLDEYMRLEKQVILTSTLKKEEYNSGKYSEQRINSIDYSKHPNGKLLSPVHNDKFRDCISTFGGLIVLS